MKFESFFRPKPKAQVEAQVKTVEEKNDIKLIHESIEDESGALPVSELKEKYKVRYDVYLKMLRAERQNKDLTDKETSKAKILINALNNLDDYILAQERGEHSVLRGRQIPVFNEIRDAIEKGITAGYVKLPTGVGKTVLFTQVIEAMGIKSLICVPSINLVNKTNREIDRWTTKTHGRYMGREKDTSKEITVSTYQSLNNAVRDGIIQDNDYPLIILDEAHKSLGDQTKRTVDSLEGIKLGFTATPNYSQEKAVKDLLPEEIYSMELRESIEEGLICRTKTIHAYTEVDLSSVPIKNREYEDVELEKAINVRGRNMAALELYKNKFSHLKAIVNCSGIQHSKDVAALFQEEGIKVAHIDGTMTEDEQNEILEKLKTGEIMVVTNAKILLEGFDEQSVSVALNLNPTLSMIDAEQRGGRALRLEDGNPDKWSYVVDFIDKDAKNPQILFSEILEGDVAVPIGSTRDQEETSKNLEEGSEAKPPINFDEINIEGLRVVVNTKEIMEVTKQFQESRKAMEKKHWTYDSLREDVLAKGITTSTMYSKKTKENQWPAALTLRNSLPDFPKNPDGSLNWDMFLGREKRKEWTGETLQEDVRSKSVVSSADYLKRRKENQWPAFDFLTKLPGLPKNPDGSLNWDMFLGREKRKTWTYESLKEDVRAKGVKSSGDYIKKSQDNQWLSTKTLAKMPEFPKNGDGSLDWDTFLGRERRKTWTYATLQEDVRSKGVKTGLEYVNKAKENQWPSWVTLKKSMTDFPRLADNSLDWDTFFGREKRKVWTYETLEADVRSKGVKSSGEYINRAQENQWTAPQTLLKMPEFPKNGDGSLDWDTFLGREKTKDWTYESLKEDVRAKGVKSSVDYFKKMGENEWPAYKKLVNVPGFPLTSRGLPDWKGFFNK